MSESALAVVLFNLGGPDSPEAVRPFLFNLFNDAAIIRLPQPFRWLLARVISGRRAATARAIYAHLGGCSPLLELTRKQADALAKVLDKEGNSVEVFVAMRYWHPMSDEVARDVAAFKPDEVVLLPLYPQFSTTTTESSLADWHRAAARHGLTARTSTVGCYPTLSGMVAAQAGLIDAALEKLRKENSEMRPRILFSAHGLPKKIVDGGDPYQWQVTQTAKAVMAALERSDLDTVVCYQSKVGRLEWISPSTDDEIERAGRDGVAVVVVPIAFVSEHSETLVELDIEYRALAERCGVSAYERVPAVGTHPAFVEGLAGLVDAARGRPGVTSETGTRLCPANLSECICGGEAGHD
jgi:ferrochelatase